jgi:predicted ArsR family transcriptional regulator
MPAEPLDAVADPGLRAALLFARSQAEPITADDAAAALEVHRNVARGRLDRLAAAGLLEVTRERRTGRSGPGAGRPAKVYRVAPELEAIEFPPRHFDELVAALVEELPESALRRAGAQFGRQLAMAAGLRPVRDLVRGLGRACAAVRSLGYQASLVSVEGDRAVISTPTCPLRPLVARRPETAEIDRGMWAGLVERALDGVRAEDVRCETADCLDEHRSCRVVLELAAQEASASGDTASR